MAALSHVRLRIPVGLSDCTQHLVTGNLQCGKGLQDRRIGPEGLCRHRGVGTRKERRTIGQVIAEVEVLRNDFIQLGLDGRQASGHGAQAIFDIKVPDDGTVPRHCCLFLRRRCAQTRADALCDIEHLCLGLRVTLAAGRRCNGVSGRYLLRSQGAYPVQDINDVCGRSIDDAPSGGNSGPVAAGRADVVSNLVIEASLR
ncbi:hypothetical protein D9M72_210380 [compost metagenome]